MKKFLFLLLFASLSQLCFAQQALKSWSFDGDTSHIAGSFRWVDGVDGQALKLDGFTTVVSEDASRLAGLTGSFTIECWIALAAYPWNYCPLITQMKSEEGGFSLDIGPRGELAFSMYAGHNEHRVISDETLPLRQWKHVAAVYRAGEGLRLYIDGNEVAACQTSGQPAFARQTEIRIGMNYTAVFPSNRIGENGITPYWFSIDGILDELRVYGEALHPDFIRRQVLDQEARLAEPQIHPRHLPRVDSRGSFQACYTQLDYYPEWDQQWPVGPDADIVITFAASPVKLIFWRGTRYSPAWVTDNHLWMCDQSVETWNGEEGCKEHMQDRHCRYSHVRIIENTPARKVIHWRYAPVSAYDTHWLADEKTGWEVWVDEYYYIYPDATGVRKVTWKTDYFGYPRQFQETLPLTEAGQLRGDVMELDYLRIANLDGDQMQLWYTETPRKPDQLDVIPHPNIQQHNFRSIYDPFIIFEPGNQMHYVMDRDLHLLGLPGSCNHWPVGQAYCDGRRTQAADRPSHFLGFPISDPLIHDEENGRSYWAGLYGMKEADMDELIALGRSWAQAPVMQLTGKGYTGGIFDRSERCYQIVAAPDREELLIRLAASTSSPLYNPALVIQKWGDDEPILELNGKKLRKGSDFEAGFDQRMEGTDLIIWLSLQADQPIQLTIR